MAVVKANRAMVRPPIPPIRFGSPSAGDSRGDRHQHDRNDEHPDRADEQVADELHIGRGLRPERAEQQAERQRGENALPQRDREPAPQQAHGQVPGGRPSAASARPAAAPVSAPLSTAGTPLTSTVRTPAASSVGCLIGRARGIGSGIEDDDVGKGAGPQPAAVGEAGRCRPAAPCCAR